MPASDITGRGAAPGTPRVTAPPIRGYIPGDRDAVYDVCVRTGDAGNDARGKFRQEDLLPDIYAGPYVELEPELAFVLDDGGTAVGYVIGTADTEAFVRSYRQHWIPRLADRYRAQSKTPANAEEELVTRAFSPGQMLDADLERYPAHLHIDLLPPYQGVGNGRRIIERFFESVAQAGARGVHVVVAASNTRAHAFYRRVGFEELELPGHFGRRLDRRS